jgi:hypothetical protein
MRNSQLSCANLPSAGIISLHYHANFPNFLRTRLPFIHPQIPSNDYSSWISECLLNKGWRVLKNLQMHSYQAWKNLKGCEFIYTLLRLFENIVSCLNSQVKEIWQRSFFFPLPVFVNNQLNLSIIYSLCYIFPSVWTYFHFFPSFLLFLSFPVLRNLKLQANIFSLIQSSPPLIRESSDKS